MSGGIPLDLIIFAIIAVFLIFRLGSVLGKKTGHRERPDFMKHFDNSADKKGTSKHSPAKRSPPDGNVVHLSGSQKFETPEDEPPDAPVFEGPAAQGMKEIYEADGRFDPQEFIAGACQAFEIILQAFAEGDKATLKTLLSRDVYKDFSEAITEREKKGHRMEDTLVGIDRADIVSAELAARSRALVTVKFVSLQVDTVWDAQGEIVSGDTKHVEPRDDIWTFARDVRSDNPNWVLAETHSVS